MWFKKSKCKHENQNEYTHIDIDGVVDKFAVWCTDCGKELVGKKPKPPNFYVGGDM